MSVRRLRSTVDWVVMDLPSSMTLSESNRMLENEIEFIKKSLDIFCCPKCSGELRFKGKSFDCLICSQSYSAIDNIPQLFWSNEWDPSKEDVTEKIKSFYEKNPFPSYDDFDNVGTLINKARKGLFAKLLDD